MTYTIPSITKEEEAILNSLAYNHLFSGKSTLFIIPVHNERDDADKRAQLIKEIDLADHLVELELMIDVTEHDDFKEVRTNLRESKEHREVKLYLLSPIGLSMYRAIPDQWTDEQKEDYTERMGQYEKDKKGVRE
jgi:hypothetical protein